MKKNKFFKLVAGLFVIAFMSTGMSQSFAQGKVIDKVIAIVGGNEILYSDV